MGNYRQSVLMNGSGSEQFLIPTGYPFMSVINNTDNILYIYQENVSVNQPQFSLLQVPQYQSQTIPITTARQQFTVFYLDGGSLGTKKVDFIFSEENLQMNSTLGTAISGSVTLAADGVGLARQNQLPAALAPSGGLKVEHVDLGRQTGKATAAGDVTIKATAGKVWAIVCITAGVTAKLKDGATEKWGVNPATPANFSVPIACNTSIVVNLSDVGEAYVLYE